MKSQLIIILFMLGAATCATADYQYTDTETINHEIVMSDQSEKPLLKVYNVYGSIDIEGYDGKKIIIEAVNQVKGKSENWLAQGIDEIGLKFVKKNHETWVYLDSPFTYVDMENGKIWHSDTCRRHDDCSKKHERKEYSYDVDIKIKVPRSISLELSTINNGTITVMDVDSDLLSATNINGPIDLVDVSAVKTYVNALNKNINIHYTKNPTVDSKFESLNGDINIFFAGKPDAKVVYKTMNGEIYTAYEIASLPLRVKRSSEQKEHGIQYKLDANSQFQIGQGGVLLEFNTLNGDVKLQ